jgi:DNA helicase IV
MAKRRFELPGIQDLSKEQEAARALPKEGQHLIVGGPGTGKSVLALLRTGRHQRERDDYLFLVFNHLLDRASVQLFGGDLASRTWFGWFLETFEKITGQSVPRIMQDDDAFRKIDWTRVDAIVQSLPDEETLPRPILVIDEGQDMPPAFYNSLIGLGFDRFFVVADQNQQITEANSSRLEIQDCLAINSDAVIELRQNYRNHFQVARLAREFYTGDPASPPPELPGPAAGTVPLLYVYEESSLEAVARGILLLADRDPCKLIGVIAPKNTVRERYLKALRSTEVELDNQRPSIETFHGDNRPDVAFDEGGILVINAQGCKGLEFDTVVLADIDEHFVRRDDPDQAKRLFYVMVARARERVFMFKKRGEGREIEKILPSDENVLRRKEL